LLDGDCESITTVKVNGDLMVKYLLSADKESHLYVKGKMETPIYIYDAYGVEDNGSKSIYFNENGLEKWGQDWCEEAVKISEKHHLAQFDDEDDCFDISKKEWHFYQKKWKEQKDFPVEILEKILRREAFEIRKKGIEGDDVEKVQKSIERLRNSYSSEYLKKILDKTVLGE